MTKTNYVTGGVLAFASIILSSCFGGIATPQPSAPRTPIIFVTYHIPTVVTTAPPTEIQTREATPSPVTVKTVTHAPAINPSTATLAPTHTRLPATALTPTPRLPTVTTPVATETSKPTSSVNMVAQATPTSNELIKATVSSTPIPPTPTPAITQSPTTTALPASTVTVKLPVLTAPTEKRMSILSYGWKEALISTSPADAIYPYPHMDFSKLGGVKQTSLQVMELENDKALVVVCPELGGRILRWFDKRKNRDVLYVNKVLKPTHWGYRGWWFATGGIEWAFPTNEHGLNEWRPWGATRLSATAVTVYDHEDRTGLDVSVTIQLNSDGSLAITPRIMNRTGQPQSFQFWVNGMLPFSPNASFELPAQHVLVHSTGDNTLPKTYERMTWPKFNGRDFSKASEWRQYLGIFTESFTGNEASVSYPDGTKIIRRFTPGSTRGVKLFLLGDLPASIYTDDNSRYLELWGGLTRTFDEYARIETGGNVAWTEYWEVR